MVFPEAALTEKEYLSVRGVVLEYEAFLVAGVLRKGGRSRPAENVVVFDASHPGYPFSIEQRKHHRWRLDRGQIEMYGLGGTLDPTRDWWEHIAVEGREVHFLTLNG